MVVFQDIITVLGCSPVVEHMGWHVDLASLLDSMTVLGNGVDMGLEIPL